MTITTIPNLIAGRALVPDSAGARYADVFNPSRAEVIARVPLGGPAEVDANPPAGPRRLGRDAVRGLVEALARSGLCVHVACLCTRAGLRVTPLRAAHRR